MSGADDLEEHPRPAAATDGGVADDVQSGIDWASQVPAESWPSQNDCVTHRGGDEPDDLRSGGSSPTAVDEPTVTHTHDGRPTPLDRVEEFGEEYPHLAQLSLTEQHGRSLRREVTDADYEPEYVAPDREWENGHVTYRLTERRAATWQDAVFAFLDAHERYEQGMSVRFSGTDDSGDEIEFTVPLQDSWGEAYANKEYARAMALERQLAGGEHPDGTEIEGEWDDIVTVMLTFTGSSVPDDDRLAPVDQFDPVTDSWSYGGTRDTVRNICENDLGLESHEWAYLRFNEPHGVGAAESDGTPGMNACYSHTHVGVYLNLDPSEHFQEPDLEAAEFELEKAFRKSIDKHLDTCDLASFEAHNYTHENPDERPISVNSNVANMGSYLSAYMRTYGDEDLVERPIEYVAWGAVMWSMNRQRIGRSKVLNEAITADSCAADFRDDDCEQSHDHGDRLVYSHQGYGSEIVCASCGSGFRVDPDAETIAELRLEAERREQREHDLARDDRPDDDAEDENTDWYGIEKRPGTEAAKVGQSVVDKDLKNQIEQYVDVHGTDVNPSTLLGELQLNPSHLPLVKQILSGEEIPTERDSFSVTEEPDKWEIEAFIDENGEEHLPSSTGGVDMKETHLPTTHLLEDTRLRYVGDCGHPKIRCKKCNVAMYNPEHMAGHFVHKHDLEEAAFVDHLLKFHSYDRDLPEEYHEPVSPLPDSV